MTLACPRRRATLLFGASFALGRKQPWAAAVDELSESCALRTLALTVFAYLPPNYNSVSG